MNRWKLSRAATTLQKGGVIAYPTESVYGLGVDPFNHGAIRKLLTLKNRPPHKGLIIVGAHTNQLKPFIDPHYTHQLTQLNQSFQHPTTWLFPAKLDLPYWLTGDHDTIALRIIDHPSARALCTHLGYAITSTSANLQGRPPAQTALDIRRYFGSHINAIDHTPVGHHQTPSIIRHINHGKILRHP